MEDERGLKVMRKNKQDSVKKFSLAVVAVINLVPFLALASTSSMPSVPTVDDCVSRTGQTKAQCTEMINKFKNMSPSDAANVKQSSGATEKQVPVLKRGDSTLVKSNDAVDANQVVSNIDEKIERVIRMQAEKEQQFIQAESRIEKIIEFLKSKSIDTAETESNLEIFKTKAAAVSSSFDAYAQALSNSKTDTSETASAAVQSAQAQIKTMIIDLVGSYGTLRNSLGAVIEKITQ